MLLLFIDAWKSLSNSFQGVCSHIFVQAESVMLYLRVSALFECLLQMIRQETKKLQNWQMPFKSLSVHFQVKTQESPNYACFQEDLQTLAAEQENFISKILNFVCECQVLDKVQELCFLWSRC